MSEQSTAEKSPKVLRFLNDYRKQLSLLKIKSFYANHLCKKNCLEGHLKNNNDACMKECDDWLNAFYQMKTQKNPDPQEILLFSSKEVPQAQRAQYERGAAKLRLGINAYVEELSRYIDTKIAKESKK